jgi:uncharacterized protein YjhX (UPF0386 family)
MEHMEHVGAVSMGGKRVEYRNKLPRRSIIFFCRGDLRIWLVPVRKGPFKREEIVSIGGRLMSEREILSRIRRLQASGDGSSMSRIALNLLRSAKNKALIAEEKRFPLFIAFDLIL